jgi:hypothetical protein
MNTPSNNTWGMIFLALILVSLVGVGLYCLSTGRSMEGSSMVVGALIAMGKDLMGYFWGSSVGSKEKDEVIKQLTQRQ